jgi:hypothetical protein
VVDVTGQRVNATDRLYLAQEVPTLIVWGDRDPLIPVAHGRHAHRVIKGSVLKVYRGVGHFPHFDEPDRFVEDLVGFIDATEPARGVDREWRELIRAGVDTQARRPARRRRAVGQAAGGEISTGAAAADR